MLSATRRMLVLLDPSLEGHLCFREFGVPQNPVRTSSITVQGLGPVGHLAGAELRAGRWFTLESELSLGGDRRLEGSAGRSTWQSPL